MSRAVERQINFADWELMRQGLRLEPVLQAISDFLDDQQNVIERVRSDLVRGLKNAATGRSGLTPQQVLRSLVLMRVKNWDYRELRERIADGYTLRQFTDFHSRRVPRHDAFHRGFTRLTPATLKAINELVVAAAVDLELEDGRQLRVDTTVVQTDIHHPTDNTLFGMSFASSRAWSAASPKRWDAGVSRGSGIEHDRHGVGCWRSNG